MIKRYVLSSLALLSLAGAQAESMDGHTAQHSGMHDNNPPRVASQLTPTEPGQTAFATIQEIVVLLETDPDTDWSQVNIEALRQHLIDMDNVTLRAQVSATEITGGVRYTITSEDPVVAAGIERMVTNHWRSVVDTAAEKIEVNAIDGGVTLSLTTSTGEQLDRLKALGFIGWLTSNMHHQAHHLASAMGQNPH
jgi:hypothetical protein